ncbi:MAG TPA: DMT family transporter [Burkholderiaceae bacterium]|nr:DMT family transporter [Burkholderiaceae bacterium]
MRALGWSAVALTALAMLAFAGNSLLCRMALKHTNIDPATFTSVRLAAGVVVLWLAACWRRRDGAARPPGDWRSAFALFVYAAAFSYAYVGLTAATGALVLFGAVQMTMMGTGLLRGERLQPLQWAGFALAVGGLVYLLLPGIAAPSPLHAALMVAAGVAWGVYSLRGKGATDPVTLTAGNFLRALAPALLLSVWMWRSASADATGLAYAVASGALASGAGYVVWYTVLPRLRSTQAATVQLSVPVIAAVAAVFLLGEAPGWRLVVASVAVLGGVALALRTQRS